MSTITGTSGVDTLDGTTGNDTILGLEGDDSLNGRDGDDVLDGGAGKDRLVGGLGDDTLEGGSGADIMRGQLGNDIYYVDDSGDVAMENLGEGIDTVFSSITYRLRENVENLNLSGSAVRAIGNALDNRLVGTSGNNIIDGLLGSDTMLGGLGDDRYYVDIGTDTVVENAGEGTDTVYSSANYIMSDNVENLNLIGTAVRGTGNGLANRLVGNSRNNILDGGSGADVMRGGLGDDRYYVDNSGDLAIENAGEGSDSVFSTISYRLRANLENLTLSGSAAINGTGNGLANQLVGNSGDNRLDGGAGADTLSGGLGNDTYVVDNAGDTVVEDAGAGTDTVYSSISLTLGSNVENLHLTGTAAAGTGNDLANHIVGNDSNNFLSGGSGDDVLTAGAGDDDLDGGEGADIMRGGLGNDTYHVDNVGDVIEETINPPDFTTVYSQLASYTLPGFVRVGVIETDAGASLTGNAGGNGLVGGGGNDTLSGGDGADTLHGLAGDDILIGGSGDDSFRFDDGDLGGVDTIRDFHSPDSRTGTEHDQLNLFGIDANVHAPNDQAFTYIGSAAFSGTEGQLRADVTTGGRGTVYHFYGDVDGDAVSDFEVIVQIVDGATLSASDMVL